MIKLDFQFETIYGKFADALYLPDDHTFTDAELEAMKEQRRDAWIWVVENPLPSTEEDISDIVPDGLLASEE